MSGLHEQMRRIMAGAALKTGWFRYDWIETRLPSGRVFKYKMTDYPFRALATDEEIDALCCRLIKDKYRYCDWDREHPKTNAEVEIFDALKAWVMGEVSWARRIQAEADAASTSER